MCKFFVQMKICIYEAICHLTIIASNSESSEVADLRGYSDHC